MLTSKFKGESSRKDQTCDAKDLWATHRSDLSKKLYSPVLDRRTHPFAGKQKISFWKYTFGTVGGQKGVYVCWKFGEIFEVLAHEMMPFFLAYRSRMFAFGSRWHFFE